MRRAWNLAPNRVWCIDVRPDYERSDVCRQVSKEGVEDQSIDGLVERRGGAESVNDEERADYR